MPNSRSLRLPKPKLKAGVLYLGDNGRCFCATHAGTTALYTGRDLSGQRVMVVTPVVLAEYRAVGFEPKCETPSCTVRAKE